ncbi:MAG: Rieske (2Fe-2S) protein [Alphaproteobacteria bacterium]|nr:Rieske (2Fe-2S) protein [Alphaproteobacteria bacterium]
MKDWLCVGRAEEIDKPGDFMAFCIMGEPIVVTRNHAGAIQAFANVCAHRGVGVAGGAGNTGEFMCPYHGWLYDLDGRLLGAPYMKDAEGFDPKTCRLPPIQCGTWQGWVFVNFDAGAIPLVDYVADWDRKLGFLHMERCRLADKLVFEIDCN